MSADQGQLELDLVVLISCRTPTRTSPHPPSTLAPAMPRKGSKRRKTRTHVRPLSLSLSLLLSQLPPLALLPAPPHLVLIRPSPCLQIKPAPNAAPAAPGAAGAQKTPKSFVVQSGTVGGTVSQLTKDVRRVLEPNTASRLRVRPLSSFSRAPERRHRRERRTRARRARARRRCSGRLLAQLGLCLLADAPSSNDQPTQ